MKKIFILLIIFGVTRWEAFGQINASDSVIFDLSRATCTSSYFIVPVSIKSTDVIYALDFSMKYTLSKITYNSIINYYPTSVTASANYYTGDSTLRFTSFCMSTMVHDTAIVAVRFNFISGPVTVLDFNSIHAYLNGDGCSYKVVPPIAATIAASGPTVIASGDTLSLIGTPGSGLSYLWSTGATTSSINITIPGTYMVTVTNSGGCSSSTAIVITGSSLPVELVTFTATENNNTVLLEWSTVSEINNDYFTVEKTADGNRWQELENIPGARNSNTLRNYSITDQQPFAGINYYRLKQTDLDGTFSYSEIVPINFKEQDALSVYVFPNPAAEILNVVTSETATWQLLDAAGQTIFIMPDAAAGKVHQINTGKLVSGIYILKTISRNSASIRQIMVDGR